MYEEQWVFAELQKQGSALIWWYTANAKGTRWRLTRVMEKPENSPGKLLHLECLSYRVMEHSDSECAELTPATCAAVPWANIPTTLPRVC